MSLQGPGKTETMIDIETLDTSHTAVILSVGIVRFTGADTGAKKHLVLPIQPQLNAGRTISESTLLWWAEQNPEAFSKAFTRDRYWMTGFFNEMEITLHRFRDEPMNIWSNGPSFDMTILDSLYADFKKDTPWHFREYRDVRTIKELAQIEPDWQPVNFTPIPHDPVSDCLWQIELVREARRRLSLSS